MTQVAFTWRRPAPRALRSSSYRWSAERKNGHKPHDRLDASLRSTSPNAVASACEILCLLWRLFVQWSVSLEPKRKSRGSCEVRSPTTGHTGPVVLNFNYRCLRSNNWSSHVDLFSSSLKWTFTTIIIITFDPYISVKFSCTDSLATCERFPGHPILQRWRQPTVVVWLSFASKAFFPKAGCATFELFPWKCVGEENKNNIFYL